jgi:hypothetical protein
MEENEWIRIFETSKMHEALLVQSMLKEHDIVAVILNQQDSSYITLGEISLYVALEDSIEALNLIEEQTSN